MYSIKIDKRNLIIKFMDTLCLVVKYDSAGVSFDITLCDN